MRLSAVVWCCLIAVLSTACESGPAARSGPLVSGSQSGSESEYDHLSDVASRITVALADVCQCRAQGDTQSPNPGLCGYPIEVENSARLYASTNGKRIRLTSGMLRYFESDDELAFVLAHELSHILLGHAGAFSGFSQKSAEIEADRLGIRIVSAAHFDTELAAEFPERLAQSYPGLRRLDGTYPEPDSRTAMIRSALRDNTNQLARIGPQGGCTQ